MTRSVSCSQAAQPSPTTGGERAEPVQILGCLCCCVSLLGARASAPEQPSTSPNRRIFPTAESNGVSAQIGLGAVGVALG